MTDTDTDHDLYARQGIGSQIGFGDSPAVVVVDYQLAFTRGAARGRLPRGRAELGGAHLQCRACSRRTRDLLVLRLRGRSLGRRPVRRQVPGVGRLPARERRLRDRSARGARRGRRRVREAAAIGILRHRPPRTACRAGRRHRRRLRHHDVGLRPRHGRRRHVARLSHDRAGRGRRRTVRARRIARHSSTWATSTPTCCPSATCSARSRRADALEELLAGRQGRLAAPLAGSLAFVLLLGLRRRPRDRGAGTVRSSAHVVLARKVVPGDIGRHPLGREHREQALRAGRAATRAGRGRRRGCRDELLESLVAGSAAVFVDRHGTGV